MLMQSYISVHENTVDLKISSVDLLEVQRAKDVIRFSFMAFNYSTTSLVTMKFNTVAEWL